MSSNIPDGRRSVISIAVSPQGNLAAAVDSFGRVLLLETESLSIRRMWKGSLHYYSINVSTRFMCLSVTRL